MLRTVVSLYLLALLAVPLAPAQAHSTWWFWLSKPERHGSRKLAGDFTHINATYRYHSRERRGLFAFLHRRPGTVARHRKGQHHAPPHKSGHMTL